MKKEKLTKVGLMLFLYHIPTAYIGDLFECDERQFKPMIENTCKSYKRDVIRNLCSFLNISVGTLIEYGNENDKGSVYISNINLWIDFNLYIYFRSVSLIIDQLNEEKKEIIHNLNFNKVGKSEKCRDLNYLLSIANKLPLINSSGLRIYNETTYPYDQKQYAKLIYPYISDYVSEEDFVNRAEGRLYKEIVSLVMQNVVKNSKEETSTETNKLNKILEDYIKEDK